MNSEFCLQSNAIQNSIVDLVKIAITMLKMLIFTHTNKKRRRLYTSNGMGSSKIVIHSKFLMKWLVCWKTKWIVMRKKWLPGELLVQSVVILFQFNEFVRSMLCSALLQRARISINFIRCFFVLTRSFFLLVAVESDSFNEILVLAAYFSEPLRLCYVFFFTRS